MELVTEVALSYKDYINKIPNGALYIANSLRTEYKKEALDEIKNFSEGITWLVNANNLLNKNGINFEIDIQKINEFLIEINDGLEIQDYILVSDIFEYEIAPYFLELGSKNE